MQSEIKKIEEFISKRLDDDERVGILNGLSGIALFYSKIICYDEVGYNPKLMGIIDKIDYIISNRSVLPSLCSGLSGYGLVLIECRNNISIDNSYFQSIDEILSNFLKEMSKDYNCDFLHGSMGICLYFIERYKMTKDKNIYKILEYYYSFLNLSISKNLEELLLQIEPDGKEVIYFGNAHGVSSILNFLYYLSKVLTKKSEDEFRILINYLKKHEIKKSSYKFPNCYVKNENRYLQSRLSWCQGDLGIGNAYMNLGQFFNKKNIFEEGKDLIENTTKVNYNKTGVIDVGICHGSAGIILQYFLFSIKSKIHLKNIERWNNNIIEQTNNFTSIQAFSNIENKYFDEINILEGAAGLGLTLLTINKKINTDWLKYLNLY